MSDGTKLYIDQTARAKDAGRQYFVRGLCRWWDINIDASRSFRWLAPDGSTADDLRHELFARNKKIEFDLVPPPGPPEILELADKRGRKIYAQRNEIVIGFADRDAVHKALIQKENGLKTKWYDRVGNFGAFRFTGKELSDVIEKLNGDDRILFAEPNILDGSNEDYDRDDTEADDLTELPLSLWNHKVIDLEATRRVSDGLGVAVAVVDWPIDVAHPALAGTSLLESDSFVFDDGLPKSKEHGTAVASIILGQTLLRNGAPLGIAPKAKLLPVAVNMSEESDYAKRAMAINSLAKVALNRQAWSQARLSWLPVERLIVNCSWKLNVAEDLTATALAFERLRRNGALCVCSAGNLNSDSPHFPSDYSHCISVAGITRSLQKSPGSNFGAGVDLCAPGGDGLPLTDEDILIATTGGKYRFNSGTSFAAPHVAAALAAAWSRNPEMSANELERTALPALVRPFENLQNQYAGKLGAGVLSMKRLT